MRRISVLLASLAGAALVSVGLALAASSSDAQANNPQVAGVADSNVTATFPTNKQNEPSIAVDPLDASTLVAGSNDEQLQPPCGPGPVRGSGAAANDCSFFPNVGTDGIYTSSDGGATWTNRGLLPGFSDYPGDPDQLVSDGDPVLFWGPEPDGHGGFSYANGARAYYGSLASYNAAAAQGNQAPELLTVSTSDDGGASGSDPTIAANGHGYRFNDKPDFWADRNPGSPYFGRVYATWTQFRDVPGNAEPVEFAYSADGGKTWTRPNQLSIAQNRAFGGRQGSIVRSGPDGTVYAIWEDSDVHGTKQVVAISHNGGTTFSKPLTIAYDHDIADPIPGANFRTDSFASAAVDQASGEVYVAWSDRQAGLGQMVVSHSTTEGQTWSSPVAVGSASTGYAFFQGLDVAPNGRVDLGWQALNAIDTSTYGTGNATVDAYYSESTDNGSTWSAPTKVTSVSSDPAASAQNDLQRQFWGDYNTLVSTDAHAWFIYTDSRNGVGCPAVDAYQHSVDGSGPAAPKPAPENDCASQFGNSDVFVSTITP
jgi:hypothetical protein